MMAVEVVPDTRAGLLARRLLASLLCRVGRRGRLFTQSWRHELPAPERETSGDCCQLPVELVESLVVELVARRGRLCLSGCSVWVFCLGVLSGVFCVGAPGPDMRSCPCCRSEQS